MRKPIVHLAGSGLSRSGSTRGFVNYRPEETASFFHNNNPTRDSLMVTSLHNKIGGDGRNNTVFMVGIKFAKSLIVKCEGEDK